MTLITLAEWNSRHWWYRQLKSSSESSMAKPTVATVPRSALPIRRDSLAASAGWSDEVQMRGAAVAGGVLAGAGVFAGPGVLAAAGVLTGGRPLGAAVVRAGAGVPVQPEISRAESARAYQGHRPCPHIAITLLRQRIGYRAKLR